LLDHDMSKIAGCGFGSRLPGHRLVMSVASEVARLVGQDARADKFGDDDGADRGSCACAPTVLKSDLMMFARQAVSPSLVYLDGIEKRRMHDYASERTLT